MEIGPGTYNIDKKEKTICMVVYRSCSPIVNKNKLEERVPSPTRYFANDDLTKQKTVVFSFKKEGVEEKRKLEDLDRREALDLDYR